MTKGKFAFLVLSMVLAGSSAGADQLYISSESGVNLRSRPSASSRDIGGLPHATLVNILAIEGNWAKVRWDGAEGWVYTLNGEIRSATTTVAPVAPVTTTATVAPVNNGVFLLRKRTTTVTETPVEAPAPIVPQTTVPTVEEIAPVVAPTPAPAPVEDTTVQTTPDTPVMVVTGNNVNFRVAANDDVISKLDEGARVRVLGTSNGGFIPVEWNGIPGVISDRYVRAAASGEDYLMTPPQVEVDIDSDSRGYLRAAPSANGYKIGTLGDGADLVVTGRPEADPNNTGAGKVWIPVRTMSGVFGYVHNTLVDSAEGKSVIERAEEYGEVADIDSPPIGVLTLGQGLLESDTEAGFICGGDCQRGSSNNPAFINPFSSNTVAGGVSVSNKGFTSPIPGAAITSWFGPRSAPTAGASTNHKGIDFRAAVGTPVLAAKGGRVTQVISSCRPGRQNCGKAGNLVVIEHPDGTRTRYFHLSTINVSEGDTVAIGEQFAKSGDTGNISGPHLHFEIQVKNRAGAYYAVNPLLYLMDNQGN